MKGQAAATMIIMLTVGAVVGIVVGLGVVQDITSKALDFQQTVNETISIHDNVTVTAANFPIRPGSTNIRNNAATGNVTLTEGTIASGGNYTVNNATGVITPVRMYENFSTAVMTYQWQDATYVNDTAVRSIYQNLPLLFGVLILGIIGTAVAATTGRSQF